MPAHTRLLTAVPATAEGERFVVRVMREDDLSPIVRIDQRVSGKARREFHAEKLAACLQEPAINTSLVAEADGTVVGFLMGKLFFGEFGVPVTRAVLDGIGVQPEFAHQGVAHALFEQYARNMGALGVEAIDTLVDWDRFDLLGFLGSLGFRPSLSVQLSWDLARHPPRHTGQDPGVRDAAASDLAAVSGIDADAGGTPRTLYFESRLRAVGARPERGAFLVAEREGRVRGFLAGGLYRGEFGIDEPRGVIDSLAIEPAWRNRGLASALVAGLIGSFAPQGMRRVETLCRWNDWELLRFFEHLGFRPSGRLNLELRLRDDHGA